MKSIIKILFFIFSILLFLLQVYQFYKKGLFPIGTYNKEESLIFRIYYIIGFFIGYNIKLIVGVILFAIALNIKPNKVA